MDKKEIGLRIKTIRKEKGLSQKELASLMGYKDVSTIAKIETGVNDVTTETLYKLANCLSVDIRDILKVNANYNNDYVKYIRSMVGYNKIIMNASGAIIEKDEMILLQRRSDNGKWGLPGGIMEMDETYQEGAIREVKEETGLDIKLDYLVGIYHNKNLKWPSGDKAHVICAVFKAHILSGKIQKDHESLELKFFSKDNLPEIAAIDHKNAINDFFNGIKNNID
jgi:ADP-ribose pyrophosphatase YjhB (NUDIX family)/DNA-binding Xre family transcriptional regulator